MHFVHTEAVRRISLCSSLSEEPERGQKYRNIRGTLLALITLRSHKVEQNIDGLGHKPSNSEFKKKQKFHKMTRDQVIHHV